MSIFKSLCRFEGERVHQLTRADSEKEAIALLKKAGFKVTAIKIMQEGD